MFIYLTDSSEKLYKNSEAPQKTNTESQNMRTCTPQTLQMQTLQHQYFSNKLHEMFGLLENIFAMSTHHKQIRFHSSQIETWDNIRCSEPFLVNIKHVASAETWTLFFSLGFRCVKWSQQAQKETFCQAVPPHGVHIVAITVHWTGFCHTKGAVPFLRSSFVQVKKTKI